MEVDDKLSDMLMVFWLPLLLDVATVAGVYVCLWG